MIIKLCISVCLLWFGVTSAMACTDANGFGFVNDGATDNSPVLASYTSWLPAAGGCLKFDAGTYIFSAQSPAPFSLSSSSVSSISILGSGSNLTFLKFTNPAITNGISIWLANKFLDNFHIRDLTIETTHTNLGYGINIDSAGEGFNPEFSDIENVTIRGDDFLASPGSSIECWADAIVLTNVDDVTINNVATFGTWGVPGSPGCGNGLAYRGLAPNYATILNVSNSSFSNHSVGWVLGGYWQGVTCSVCNFNGEEGTACIEVPGGQTGSLVLLNINNSQLNCSGSEIYIATNVIDLLINGNVLSGYGPNAVGVQANATQGTITGNVFNNASGGASQVGVAITSGSFNGVITSNTFQGLAVGVDLENGSTYWNTQSNSFYGVTTPVLNGCGYTCKSGGGQP